MVLQGDRHPLPDAEWFRQVVTWVLPTMLWVVVGFEGTDARGLKDSDAVGVGRHTKLDTMSGSAARSRRKYPRAVR